MKKLIAMLIAMMMLGTTLVPAVGRADFDSRHGGHDRHDNDNRWNPIHEVKPIHPSRDYHPVHYDRPVHYQRPVHYERPVHYGHGGSWHHGYHNGNLGWWFVLAGTWYAINRAAYESQVEPVVLEQPTPVTVITPPSTAPVVYQAPPAPSASMASPYWYYCRSTNSYYPYVSGCTEGWQQVAAQPVQ